MRRLPGTVQLSAMLMGNHAIIFPHGVIIHGYAVHTPDMNARLLNEEIEEEFVQTFVDAFKNSQAESLEIELKDRGTYNIPLQEDVTDFQQYFTAEE